MSGSSIYVRRADCRRRDTPIALVIIEADQLTPDERTAFALLSSRVDAALLPSPSRYAVRDTKTRPPPTWSLNHDRAAASQQPSNMLAGSSPKGTS